MLSCLTIKTLFIQEHLIPKVPTAAKGLLKQHGLTFCWKEPHLDGGVLQLSVICLTRLSVAHGGPPLPLLYWNAPSAPTVYEAHGCPGPGMN